MQSSTHLAFQLMLIYSCLFVVLVHGVAGVVTPGSPSSCNQTCDYIEYGKDAYCTSRNLTQVPQFCNQSVLLDLRGNQLHTISRGEFENFGDLKFLDLSQNSLEELPPRVFAGASKLRDLYIFNNKLVQIDHDTFAENGEIRSIYLSRNNIQALPHAAFRGLPRLRVLFLSKNSLNYINRHQFQYNMEITHMSFAQNQIEIVFSETFKHLTNLEYLDLSYNRLHMSFSFGRLTNLQTLKLVNNSLTDDFITENLLSPPNLEVVDLSGNQIEHIPYNLDESSLAKLRLANNPLQCDCPFQRLQDLYGQISGEDWVEQVMCPNGEQLITASIPCPTKESAVPKSTPEPTKKRAENDTEPDNDDSPHVTPLIIAAITITAICLLVCFYVIGSWIWACCRECSENAEEPNYRKVSCQSVENKSSQLSKGQPIIHV